MYADRNPVGPHRQNEIAISLIVAYEAGKDIGPALVDANENGVELSAVLEHMLVSGEPFGINVFSNGLDLMAMPYYPIRLAKEQLRTREGIAVFERTFRHANLLHLV